EALDKGFAFSTTCIDQRVRVAVPRKQAPKANRRRRSRFSKDDRANAVPLQQRGAPQDEGPHHQFADVRAADEQSSKMREIERIGRAPVRSRADHGQGGMPGKIAYLSAELTRSAGGKYPLPAQTIPSARNDAPLDDQPHGHVPIADIEKLFVRRKPPLRTARETKSELYLSRSQRRNDLGQSVFQQHTKCLADGDFGSCDAESHGSDWSADPMAAQQPIERVRPLLGKEKPRSGRLDGRSRSWDRFGQPVRPSHWKVDIVRGPDDQRRSLELTQLGLDGQSVLVVECADEALQIVGTLLVAQVWPQVDFDIFIPDGFGVLVGWAKCTWRAIDRFVAEHCV